MKRILVVCLLCLLPVISYANEPEKRAQVEELLALMDVDSIVDTLYTQVNQMMHNMGRELGVKPTERELFERYNSRIVEVLRKEMNWEKMKSPMIDLYLKHYTEKEIRDMAAFYRSDTGRSMIRKMPVVMRDSMMVSQQMMRDVLPKIHAISKELEEELKFVRVQ